MTRFGLSSFYPLHELYLDLVDDNSFHCTCDVNYFLAFKCFAWKHNEGSSVINRVFSLI